MRTIKNEIISIVKSIEGNLLCFGIDEEQIINEIEKNNKILNCDLLNCNIKIKQKGKGRNKQIPIKKITKKYKKKNINYIITNMDDIYKYKKYFIKDSIYISNKKIYLYTKEDYQDRLIKMYERYNVKIEKLKCEDGIILIIESKKTKKKILKDLKYLIIDTIIDIYDLIGDILVS